MNKLLDENSLRAIKTYVDGQVGDLSEYAKKIGPLPFYTVQTNDKILDLIVDEELAGKIIALNIVGPYGGHFLACFSPRGADNYGFELESLEGNNRFYQGSLLLTDVTWANILTTTYQDNYELVSNKVTTLSATSSNAQYPSAKTVYEALSGKEDTINKVALSSDNTNTQYPNAKSVWDAIIDVRETAEGKNTTYVASYNAEPVVNQWANYYYFDANDELKQFESQSEFETWLETGNCVNDAFNSDNNYINLNQLNGYSNIDYIIIEASSNPLHTGKKIIGRLFNLSHIFKMGDNFYILEIGKPDRWVESVMPANVDNNAQIGFSILETTKPDLTNYYTKSEADANIPLHQANTILITDALTNINGRALSNYTATSVTSGGYTYYQITYQDTATITEEQVKTYMKSMTGSELIPVYDYNFPVNTYFIMSNGSIWKPQYDSVNGFRLYKAGGDLLTNDKSLIPDTDNTYDLGSSSYKWKNIYLSGNLSDETNSVTVANILTTNTEQSITEKKIINKTIPLVFLIEGQYQWKMFVDSTNVFNIGRYSNYGSNLQTGYAFSNTAFYSLQEGKDLGLSGVRWRDLYLSRNLSDGTNSVNIAHLAQNTPTQWYGTQAQYDALGTYDNNTIYNILES